PVRAVSHCFAMSRGLYAAYKSLSVSDAWT
ncbi:uncharacterized protein METZ01_LOCUS281257, partial [marine metagenome]